MTTDGRIGRLLRAIRSRPSYPFESWTILVTTDHGQKPLTEPSIASHIGDTEIERISFLLGSGPGLTRRISKPRIVDIAPTVLHQLGLKAKRRWDLDGRSLVRSRPPSSASARVRGGRAATRLTLELRLGIPAPKVRSALIRLPAGARIASGLAALRIRADGAPPRAARLAGRRTLSVRLDGRALKTLSIATAPGGLRLASAPGAALTVTLRGKRGRLGRLRVELARG